MRQEVLVGVERRRRWSIKQKLQILSEVAVDGATVSDVARRHDITRQHIYQWRRDMRRQGWAQRKRRISYLSSLMVVTSWRGPAPARQTIGGWRSGFATAARYGSWEIPRQLAGTADPDCGDGMIGPGTGVRVYLACGVTDMRKGITGLAAAGAAGPEPEPDVGRGLRLSRPPGRSDQASVLGWPGLLPLLQGAGARPVSVAVAGRWGDPADLGAAGDALGRDRLASPGMDVAARARCLIHSAESKR